MKIKNKIENSRKKLHIAYFYNKTNVGPLSKLKVLQEKKFKLLLSIKRNNNDVPNWKEV